ncbi:MAG: hypothetical protein V7L12_01185 [Nostoc sp.]
MGEKPAKEFLYECWNDHPALQIVIKKLLAKFGQWESLAWIGCLGSAIAQHGNAVGRWLL